MQNLSPNDSLMLKAGYGMFIHFDSDKAAECDSCGARGTIMQMSVIRMDHTVKFCILCFGALAQATSHASKKLRLPVR
jgi:hypothetical protein